MSAWVLPDHLADVLPSEARHIEEIRRDLLDMARCYGYELVMPPLLEHLESLLTGSGEALDLQTFKLVDQLSGRMMGLRADITPQVARIDAHLLNRKGVTRLCYCGPVVHVQPGGPQASREPLQFGAELFGHSGLEADLEVLSLALNVTHGAQVRPVTVDLADARIVSALLEASGLPYAVHSPIYAALALKDASALQTLTTGAQGNTGEALCRLIGLYGGIDILDRAARELPALPEVTKALAELRWLASHVEGAHLSFDLSDMRGYAYYTGIRFALFVEGGNDALVRGGRYDEVGSVFGRKRPAVGFSLDVKALAAQAVVHPLHAAIAAPWSEDAGLRRKIAELRKSGETVVCVMPGHESEIDEFQCDREVVESDGQWVVQTK